MSVTCFVQNKTKLKHHCIVLSLFEQLGLEQLVAVTVTLNDNERLFMLPFSSEGCVHANMAL